MTAYEISQLHTIQNQIVLINANVFLLHNVHKRKY